MPGPLSQWRNDQYDLLAASTLDVSVGPTIGKFGVSTSLTNEYENVFVGAEVFGIGVEGYVPNASPLAGIDTAPEAITAYNNALNSTFLSPPSVQAQFISRGFGHPKAFVPDPDSYVGPSFSDADTTTSDYFDPTLGHTVRTVDTIIDIDGTKTRAVYKIYPGDDDTIYNMRIYDEEKLRWRPYKIPGAIQQGALSPAGAIADASSFCGTDVSEFASPDQVLSFVRDVFSAKVASRALFSHAPYDVDLDTVADNLRANAQDLEYTSNHAYTLAMRQAQYASEVAATRRDISNAGTHVDGANGISAPSNSPQAGKKGEPNHNGNDYHHKTEKPILLDLDGTDGVEVTQFSQSNQFYDTAGDGDEHRTAWAGAGDAVLAVDANGDSKIDQKNEIIFTEWDATATDDLQALRNVFDTNHNNKIDAGDDKFNDFRVLVTNADGTITTQTLSVAGIESINLLPDATNYDLADGSSVDGQTIFTRSDKSTGAAAAVSLKTETEGYAVDQTRSASTLNPDGSTTIVNTLLTASGAVSSVTTTVTSSDGKTRDISFDSNGDTIIDLLQHDVTVAGSGPTAKIETISNKTAAGVLIDQTVVTTATDGSVKFDRDQQGGAWVTQTESRNADNSSITITDLNFDGSSRDKHTIVLSNGRMTRTETFDLDGDVDIDLTLTDAIVIDGGNIRTETIIETNQNTSLRDKTVRITDSTGFVKEVDVDADGDTFWDTVTKSNAVVNKGVDVHGYGRCV